MERLKGLWANFSTTHLWRAWSRYSEARGGLLAGGVTYFAFFSLFPVIALAFTVFGLVLRDRPALLGQIREAIDKQLPGFVQSAHLSKVICAKNSTQVLICKGGKIG